MLKHDGSGIGPRIFHLSPTEWTTATILVSACLPQRRRQKYLKYHHLAQQPQAQLGFDDFESVNMVRYLPISDQCLGEIRAEPREDQFLQELSETILVGWPEHKDYTPAMTHPYFSMRDEVTVQDGFQRKLCCNPLEPSRRHEDEDSLIPPWNRSMSAGCTWMRVLKKSIRAGTDPYLTILDYRNTPTQGMTTSPEQRLMSQRAKTLLPTTQNLLLPRTLNLKSERKELRQCQQAQAKYYNRSARGLPSLSEGDVVRMKPFKLGDKSWRKAQVTARLDERLYTVDMDDEAVYHRNRQHLWTTSELPAGPSKAEPEPDIACADEKATATTAFTRDQGSTPQEQHSEVATIPVQRRRSERLRTSPAYLKDCLWLDAWL